ncbi:glycosyltransferase [Alkalihalophilus marmarensis]|uniref:glycosyltransferase n=1 Tax=Alkalihalophilus marmarensis TaxID=521377 RepID=UPI002E21714E|nr:glycosyltransferase [Alkalihalophilus marmarensis]
MKQIRALIYADIDINIIDGSAIWVTSISETLSQGGKVKVSLLLKRPVLNETLIKPLLENPNIEIINPWSKESSSFFKQFENLQGMKGKRLSTTDATIIIDKLNEEYEYNFILVRGLQLATDIANKNTFSYKTWFYITDFPQRLEEVTDDHLYKLINIYKNGGKLACQTPDLIEFFKEVLGVRTDDKFVYLPPMVPNVNRDKISFENKHSRLIYAGKFGPYWKAPEMFEAFEEIKQSDIQFYVAGNKFHNYPYQENYEEKVRNSLTSSDKIIWKQGLTRQDVQELIDQCDVGVSWRDEFLDDSKELSTKVLEYGLNGKAVILNRNELHEKLFGSDYPLFANSKEEFKDKVLLAFQEPELYKLAAERIFKVSEKHTFKEVFKFLESTIDQVVEKPLIKDSKDDLKHVLIAGHDLKFARLLIKKFLLNPRYEVKIDYWVGHGNHDEDKSLALLEWADVIICEWGLGNLAWYSKHKKKNQKLIARLHNQEKKTPHLQKVKWKNVDKVVYISDHSQEELSQLTPVDEDKKELIYNIIDSESLNKPKLEDSEFNIGMIGISPSLKRLDITIDIFEELWKKDNRYTLFVKGRLPNEYEWVWKKPEEVTYYKNLFKRINRSKWKNSVVFEGWGTDIADWMRKISFIVSTSDSESFHLAVAEGMGARCIPVVRNWEGANSLYPINYVFNTVEEAVRIVETHQGLPDDAKDLKLKEIKEYVDSRFDIEIAEAKWNSLICD